MRAWGDTPLWIGNQPPAKTVITGERYLQVIADAAMSGARWVIAFDADFAARLAQARRRRHERLAAHGRTGRAISSGIPNGARCASTGSSRWCRIPSKGGLLSGGILDMIAVKHTPVRPVPGSS